MRYRGKLKGGDPLPSSWILVVITEGTGEKVFTPFSWILVVVIQGTGKKVTVPGKRYLRYRK